jgi:EAL domain-containing protein (putative c-di-GMP-specific phosphodiesterase class I)
VRGILTTCADLGIQVVAEGVETIDEFCWLRDEGIELFQGYLFAKPMFEGFPDVRYPQFKSVSAAPLNTASVPAESAADQDPPLFQPSY